MRCLRSYRFFLILCFTLGTLVFIYRFHSISKQSTRISSNILSTKIDARLHYLGERFVHVNISMLLHRPSFDRTSSITYRCREWCGGCKFIDKNMSIATRDQQVVFRGWSIAWNNINIYFGCFDRTKIFYWYAISMWVDKIFKATSVWLANSSTRVRLGFLETEKRKYWLQIESSTIAYWNNSK